MQVRPVGEGGHICWDDVDVGWGEGGRGEGDTVRVVFSGMLDAALPAGWGRERGEGGGGQECALNSHMHTTHIRVCVLDEGFLTLAGAE